MERCSYDGHNSGNTYDHCSETDSFIDRLTHAGIVPLEITHLGSGSSGNSVAYKYEDTVFLIDCGLSTRQMEKRLFLAGMNPNQVDHILITHHHADHSKSALKSSKKLGARFHSNLETAMRMGWQPMSEVRTFSDLERIEINQNVSVMPIPVPHDDADNVAFIIFSGGERAAYVTDLGEATDELKKHLKGCSHISIEANYDHNKLLNGPYPDSLKRRISGRGGHLSNLQTANILRDVVTASTKSIVLCHLSEKNNAPHIAESEALMKIHDFFEGDLSISRKKGPEFTHSIGENANKKIPMSH